MKILFLTKLLPNPLGISGSIIIYNRIRYLVECGHQVSLLSFVRPEDEPYVAAIRPLVAELELLPAPQAESPLKRFAYQLFSTIPSPFREMRAWTMRHRVGEMVERAHVHVVIAEFSAMGQYLYRNPYLPAVRRIISCHECCTKALAMAIRFHRWSPAGLMKQAGFSQVQRYEFAMYHNADHILVLTSQERHVLLNYAPNLRVTVVPHGVDVNYYSLSPMAGREESLIFVGYYFNESNRDAVHWFVRTVWPQLKKTRPQLRFYIVGRGATSSIRDLARHDPQIVVTGEVQDIRPYLARARVFICPIRMGSGFRAKILEAMASGVPVVSTSLGAEGIPSGGGETLLLADTPAQMLRCVRLLLMDAEMGANMAAKARELVVNRFARKNGMDALNRVVNDVVAGRD
ncbi:MAG: glycosyltransferase [Kiritimatiellia bacterium]|jgi:glycosyltransferase involved in cell wall biosynthesis